MAAPTTLRLDEEHQAILDSLASKQDNPSEVLRRGLRMVAGAELSRSDALYPRLVSEPDIAEAIEAATKAAVDVLDELFPRKGVELIGVSSNFQGGLKEHITAMLTGKDSARRSTTLMLNSLFGDDRALGRLPHIEFLSNYGYGILQPGKRVKEAPAYFESDSGTFVPLEAVTAGALFTSSYVAVEHAFAWMRKEGISPRDAGLRLCVLSWSDKEDEPLQLVATAI